MSKASRQVESTGDRAVAFSNSFRTDSCSERRLQHVTDADISNMHEIEMKKGRMSEEKFRIVREDCRHKFLIPDASRCHIFCLYEDISNLWSSQARSALPDSPPSRRRGGDCRGTKGRQSRTIPFRKTAGKHIAGRSPRRRSL